MWHGLGGDEPVRIVAMTRIDGFHLLPRDYIVALTIDGQQENVYRWTKRRASDMEPLEQMMSTIKTVAERAGVSLKTVSRVFSAPETVSEAMRIRVMQAAAELDFIPDRRAQAMRSGRSGVIGLLTDVAASTPCSIDIIRGVEEALAGRGMSLLIGSMENRGESPASVLRSFRAVRVEGVIYAATYHREIFDFAPLQLPSVMVNCFSHKRGLPTVIPDEEGGGFAVGAHLIGLGHRRIAYLTLSPDIEATQLRLAGLRRAFREAGLAEPADLAVAGQSRAGTFSREEAFVAASRLLDRPDRPTAVFCGNDEMAMQVYHAAIGLGLAIPRDVSIVGFDDHRLFSEGLRPALTTVALPYVKMGNVAVSVLLDDRDAVAAPTTTLIEAPLIVRRSTASPGA
jgi:LacI family transcriptional regulator